MNTRKVIMITQSAADMTISTTPLRNHPFRSDSRWRTTYRIARFTRRRNSQTWKLWKCAWAVKRVCATYALTNIWRWIILSIGVSTSLTWWKPPETKRTNCWMQGTALFLILTRQSAPVVPSWWVKSHLLCAQHVVQQHARQSAMIDMCRVRINASLSGTLSSTNKRVTSR